MTKSIDHDKNNDIIGDPEDQSNDVYFDSKKGKLVIGGDNKKKKKKLTRRDLEKSVKIIILLQSRR